MKTITHRPLLQSVAAPLSATAALPPGESLVMRRVNGTTLACREWGRPGAPLLLMLHGIGANSLSAEVEARGLAAQGYHVVAPDFRGRNLSPATAPGTLGWRTHALDMLELTRQLGARTFSVVGHSMGAYVTMVMATLAPSRLERVVLIDAVGHVEPGAWKAIVASPGRFGVEYASADAYVDALMAKGIPSAWARSFREDLITLPNGKVTPRTSKDAVLEDLAYTSRELAKPGFMRRYWPSLPANTLLVRAEKPLVAQAGNLVSERDLRAFKAEHPTAQTLRARGVNHYSVFTDASVARSVVDFFRAAS